MKITLNNKKEMHLIIKIILFALGLLIGLSIPAHCQISPSFRAGYNQRMNSPLISPSIMLEAHNIVMQPELIIYTQRNAPTSFGLKIGYTVNGFTAGVAGYYDLYSTDKYDLNKNVFTPVGFVRYLSGKYYVQLDYHRGIELSGGVIIRLYNN